MRRSSSALLTSSTPSTFKLSTSGLLLALCLLILSTFSLAAPPDRITGPIVPSQLIKMSGGVAMQARPQYDRGLVDPSLKLGYMTLLTLPSASQQNAIDELLAQQQDPHSAEYHEWLTPDQYADRFGLSPNDIQKITRWLQSQGFTIYRVARSRNFIVFSGTAAQAEAAFRTPIHNFDVNGEKHFSNTTSPSVPAALSGIVAGIRGLNNFRAKSHVLRSKPNFTAPDTSASGYWIAPGDITTIYDIQPLYTAGITGATQTLAVMGETDVYLADLVDFRSAFTLPAIASPGCTLNANLVITACNTTNFQYVLYGTDTTGLPNSIQDDLTEADIDLEYSEAVAQDAKIIYVNSPDPSGNGVWDSWYYAIDNKVSPVITLSYGGCELGEALFSAQFPGNRGTYALDEPELKLANLYGITFMNSSGDFAAAECDPNNTDPDGALATGGLAVAYPASSPEVTGVGGTMIPYTEYTSSDWNPTNGPTGGSVAKYLAEQGWNDTQEWSLACANNASAYGTFCSRSGITSWETAQAALNIIGGGGGVSNCVTINDSDVCTGGFAQPSFQSSLSLSDLGQTTAARFSPDVSLLASVFWPGFIICTPVDEVLGNGDTNSMCANGITGTNGFMSYGFTFGGTSIATPMFAGIVTLLNQDVVQSGIQTKPGLGNINTTLYTLAAKPQTSTGSNGFNQVLTGSSQVYCQPGTPEGFPSNIICPQAVSPATGGFFGFEASMADSTTGYNLVTGLGSVDAANLAKAWIATAIASTATNITSSPNPSNFGAAVTFTATVTTTGPTSPTGTVTFYDGTTSLGTGPLTNLNATQATATFTTPSSAPLLPPSQSITAAYGGDSSNAASTSPALTQTIHAPVIDLSTPTAATPTPLLAGESATSTFTVAPGGGATTFVAAVAFSCIPPTGSIGISCTFNPPQINAGAGSTLVTATISTDGPNTNGGDIERRRRADNRSPWLPLALPLAGIVVVGLAGRKMSKFAVIACLCASLVLLGLLVACGGSSAPPPIGVSVALAPGSSATVFPNYTNWPPQSASFTATVTNTTNSAVTWSLNSSVSCTAASNPCGTITSAGVYTAPTIAVGLPPNVTVTATSQASATSFGTAVEKIALATVPTALVPGGPYQIPVQVNEGGATPNLTTSPISLTVQ
jgi:hypothetical protein